MLIEKSNLALTSTHEAQASTTRQLQFAEPPGGRLTFARLLDARLQAPPANLLEIGTAPEPQSRTEASFQSIMEMLFGLPHVPTSLPLLGGLPPMPGSGAQAVEFVHTAESERCTFAASGSVCLADGSTRQFDVSYAMERSEETNSFGVASFRDPLMLDFGPPANALSPQSVQFDLDGDGKPENMRMPDGNSAILFDDRNHNGKADDGSELFGPRSGDGFGELAQLDTDHNGWIDEGDAAFVDLKLWSMGSDGSSHVQALEEAGVGALSTQSAATPFTIKEDGAAVAKVQASGVWLGEKSGAGVIRQVDVATTPVTTQTA